MQSNCHKTGTMNSMNLSDRKARAKTETEEMSVISRNKRLRWIPHLHRIEHIHQKFPPYLKVLILHSQPLFFFLPVQFSLFSSSSYFLLSSSNSQVEFGRKAENWKATRKLERSKSGHQKIQSRQ